VSPYKTINNFKNGNSTAKKISFHIIRTKNGFIIFLSPTTQGSFISIFQAAPKSLNTIFQPSSLLIIKIKRADKTTTTPIYVIIHFSVTSSYQISFPVEIRGKAGLFTPRPTATAFKSKESRVRDTSFDRY
jgi:hypothetical protein